MTRSNPRVTLLLSVLTGSALDPEASDLVEPALGEPRRCDIRVHSVLLGGVEDRRKSVVDAVDHHLGAFSGVAVRLDGDVDDTACVDHEVRGVENAPCHDPVDVRFGCELVVRRSGDRRAGQARNRVLVEDGPECTWRKDVAIDVVDLVVGHGFGPVGLRGMGNRIGIDIGDDGLGARLGEATDNIHADFPDALNGDALSRHVGRSPYPFTDLSERSHDPVSYTHLTLPTIYSV